MKIAHLIIAGDVAGGQLVALRLIRAARMRGDDVLVMSPTPGPFVDMLRDEGVHVHFVDVGRTFHVREARRLISLLRRERVDVLHTHTALAANVLSRIAGRLAGAAVVSHMHIENHFRANRAARGIYRALDNATARLSSAIVAVSEDTRAALERQGYPPSRLETIHNGVDLGELTPPRPEVRTGLGIPLDALLLGSVGRLCAHKGQRELLEAFASLTPAHPDLWLLLVGDDLETGGAYRAGLERRAHELGVAKRMVFAGYRRDVDALLDAVDVFVLPSWIEGLPLVVLEAMAHARPVVATAVGGTPEVVEDGHTGLLVPPRDPGGLAAAIEQLVGDRVQAQRLGEAGRERVAQYFSAEEMERRVLQVYDAVLAR